MWVEHWKVLTDGCACISDEAEKESSRGSSLLVSSESHFAFQLHRTRLDTKIL